MDDLVSLLLQAAAAQALHNADMFRRLFGQNLYPYRFTVAAIQVRDHGGRRPMVPSVITTPPDFR